MQCIAACALCHIGLVRGNNEDNVLINGAIRGDVNLPIWRHETSICQESGLFAVCDGMGGLEGGEYASLLAVQRLQQSTLSWEGVLNSLHQANGDICNQANGNGSTCVVALATAEQVQVANLGDSRGYIWHSGTLTQLTQDHTVYARKQRMGFTQAQLDKDPSAKHILTQYLGIFPHEMEIEPHQAQAYPWEEGDILLLCSDGLSGLVPEETMATVLGRPTTLDAKMGALLTLALNQGGNDNITILLAERNGETK